MPYWWHISTALRTEPFECLQTDVKTGRLDQHGIAGLADRAQAQIERFHRAVGDDDLIRPDLDAIDEVAQGDLLAKRMAPRSQIVHRHPWVQLGNCECRGAPKTVEGKEEWTGEGRSQRDDVPRHR
jgi:hypothetical protein